MLNGVWLLEGNVYVGWCACAVWSAVWCAVLNGVWLLEGNVYVGWCACVVCSAVWSGAFLEGLLLFFLETREGGLLLSHLRIHAGYLLLKHGLLGIP